MAAGSSARLWTLEMPTLEPRLAGFTKSGYSSAFSIWRVQRLGSAFHSARVRARYGVCGRPAAAKSFFITSLSMPAAEPSTPEPT